MTTASTAGHDCQQLLARLRGLYNAYKLEEAVRQCRELLDKGSCATPLLRGQIHLIMADAHQWQRKVAEGEEHYHRAEEYFVEAGDLAGEWEARVGLGVMTHFRGNFGQSRHVGESAFEISRANGWNWVEARSHHLLGRVYHTLEDNLLATRHFEAARSLYLELEAPLEAAETYAVLGGTLVRDGRSAEAAVILHDLHSQFREAGYVHGLATTLGQLGLLTWHAGDFVSSREHLRRRLEIVSNLDSQPQLITALYLAALGELACEEYEEARRLATKAVALARAASIYGFMCSSQMVLALSLIQLDQPAAALNHAILSRDNMRQDLDAEAQLIHFYVAICYLAAGFQQEACHTWANKPQLKLSRDNAVEALLLDRALRHIREQRFWDVYEDMQGALDILDDWRSELLAFKKRCPGFTR